jgi:hypothetical protein
MELYKDNQSAATASAAKNTLEKWESEWSQI